MVRSQPGGIPDPDQPKYLYHGTPRSNRESILKHGLLRSKSDAYLTAKEMGEPDETNLGGGIYFDSVPETPSPTMDVWRVDVRGLNIESDDESQFAGNPEYEGHTWHAFYGDAIPPKRLTLLTR